MSTFVITIPGTFLRDADRDAIAAIARRLSPADPHHTELGREEDLDLLSVNDDHTFSIRLEVTADERGEAQSKAASIAAAALRAAGFDADEAPLGPPVVSGIDSQV